MADEHASEQAGAGYETRDVNLRKVAFLAALMILALVASVVFVWDYFVGEREQLYEQVVLSKPSAELRELRAREAEELETYKLLDSAKGQYRIPIDRAMELLAAEAYHQKLQAGAGK
jgi:hypothetical protein